MNVTNEELREFAELFLYETLKYYIEDLNNSLGYSDEVLDNIFETVEDNYEIDTSFERLKEILKEIRDRLNGG